MNTGNKFLLITSLSLFCQQANAILMATQGDAPETDPAMSTIVDDSGAGATTIRQVSKYNVEKATGASAGIVLTQTTQSNLTYIPLSFTLGRNSSGTGLFELNLKLSYAQDNEAFKTSATATSGMSDTTLGFSYYARSADTLIRTNFSVKYATGEFDDQLSSDSRDYIMSVFGRKQLGQYAIKGNAGYVLRGTGPQDTNWGDSYILKGGIEMSLSKEVLLGFDVTYTDTEESSGPFALIGISTTDAALFADYRIDASSGIYARISSPVSEETTGGAAPDRDPTFSLGLSIRY